MHADIAQARAYGATGVPFFVVDQKYGVSGAQPTEVFSQLLERAWAETTTRCDAELRLGGCAIDGLPDGARTAAADLSYRTR